MIWVFFFSNTRVMLCAHSITHTCLKLCSRPFILRIPTLPIFSPGKLRLSVNCSLGFYAIGMVEYMLFWNTIRKIQEAMPKVKSNLKTLYRVNLAGLQSSLLSYPHKLTQPNPESPQVIPHMDALVTLKSHGYRKSQSQHVHWLK